MYEIHLPDSLYNQAAEAAVFQQLSVEEFVMQAVQSRVREASQEPLRLTPDQAAKVRESLEQVRRGETLTLEELKKSLDAKKTAYFKEQEAKRTNK